jgi:hypothetical protein
MEHFLHQLAIVKPSLGMGTTDHPTPIDHVRNIPFSKGVGNLKGSKDLRLDAVMEGHSRKQSEGAPHPRP